MTIGWDIGGVNTKVARVANGAVLAARGRPFELQRAPDALPGVLRELAADVGMTSTDAHAVTMTAELSQMFRTKREGVAFVLDAIGAAFPNADIRVLTVAGALISPGDARRNPLAVAAANWAATAHVVAQHHRDALLIDVGTTTTDLIPIVEGRAAADGHTDPERLASGELVYSGAVRTPVEAIATHVPYRGSMAGVSAEGFALAGDVHVWRGDLDPRDYSVPTPDGRPPTREYAGERLARVVCADRELIDEAGITALARALAVAQVARIADAIRLVTSRHASLRTAVVTGLGAFLGRDAARAAGLDVRPLADELGSDAARCAPAACVALMRETAPLAAQPRRRADSLLVIKVGGSLVADRAQLDAAIAAIAEISRGRRVVIVPGGGPFADAVRHVDSRIDVSDDAAHWMAILAMDQFAFVLAERLHAPVVTNPSDVNGTLSRGKIGVLAPFRWLWDVDPLPHSWDVTSDSIAAWVAGRLGAEQLVLVKPAGARGAGVVDPYFSSACVSTLSVAVKSADELASDFR
jgi:probable H4MPT-linked C1 transfer pathway protein